MDKINIVLATDKNYAQHAAVTITSILCNTTQQSNIQFYIIDDNIDDDNKTKLQDTVKQFNSNIIFVKIPENSLNQVFVSGGITRAAYFRLAIPNILPKTVNKVIYLDCDLIVLDDIVNLWNLDMCQKPVAATEDFGILSSTSKCREKEINLNWKKEYSYFNSGVLLIDVMLWRKNNYASQLIELVQTHKFRHHDQDALNYLFMNNWTSLPLCWNVIPPVFNMNLSIIKNKIMRQNALKALNNISIIHYAGGYKPWEYKIYKGFNEGYYEYLGKTEYKNAKMPQPNKKTNHSIIRQLLRLKWAFLIKKFIK